MIYPALTSSNTDCTEVKKLTDREGKCKKDLDEIMSTKELKIAYSKQNNANEFTYELEVCFQTQLKSILVQKHSTEDY